jgi:hypothetical protein
VGAERDDESMDQATAEVLPSPAHTDCGSVNECVPHDNWFEGSAGEKLSTMTQGFSRLVREAAPYNEAITRGQGCASYKSGPAFLSKGDGDSVKYVSAALDSAPVEPQPK